MSAFLIDVAVIDALLTFAGLETPDRSPLRLIVPGECTEDGAPCPIDFAKPGDCSDVGGILLAGNADGLAAEYGADDATAREAYRAAEAYQFKAFPKRAAELAPTRIIAAAGLLAYQSCSSDAWPMSLAQWLGLRITEHAAATLARDADFIRVNPARGTPEEQCWSKLAPEAAQTAGEDGETVKGTDSRAQLLAKLSGAPVALPDAPTDGAPAKGPKPEPETAAKAAAKGKSKPKAKARRKAKNSSASKKASPPAAGATGRKSKAPLAA